MHKAKRGRKSYHLSILLVLALEVLGLVALKDVVVDEDLVFEVHELVVEIRVLCLVLP